MEGHKLKPTHFLSSSREKKQKASSKCKSLARSPKQEFSQRMDCYESIPTRTVVQMEMKPKSNHSRLLSSKSLSQLVPRGLFFKKSKDNKNEAVVANKLATTKSFPNYGFYPDVTMQENPATEFITNRVNSVSLIGLPRQSTSSSFLDNTLQRISLSPIVGSREGQQQPVVTTATIPAPSSNVSFTTIADNNNRRQRENKNCCSNKTEENTQESSDNGRKKANGGKLKALKNTKLVLRDVKNSIGLRMKAKQESQAFVKLNNDELASPPIKLYSPFNIYTPDNKEKTKECKSKRKLNLSNIGGQQQRQNKDTKATTRSNYNSQANCSMLSAENEQQTPKQRIVLQHKKLMQANKFIFDSPTGRLRETVKEVEHFQQCIEDISQAIRTRDQKQSTAPTRTNKMATRTRLL